MSSQAANWDGVSKISHFINRCSGLFKMLICGRHNPGAIHICLRDFTPGLIQPGRGYVEVFGGISLIGGGRRLFGGQELLDVGQPWFPALPEVDSTLGLVQALPRDHLNTLNNRTY